MQVLTGAILAAFFLYAAGWYSGRIEGNFALLLLMATIVTGAYWIAERVYFLPRRLAAAQALETDAAARRASLAKQGIQDSNDAMLTEARVAVLQQPWWLDWTAGLFPVIAIVFLMRSFLFEPFRIPSGSMLPTLLVGDLILVNKYEYGLRLPVINTKLTAGNPVQRGDVMVFRYPPNPNVDYIKRVIGLPGDEIAYINKRLSINGQVVEQAAVADFFDRESMRYQKQFEESLPGQRQHRLLINEAAPAGVMAAGDFPQRGNCRYSIEGVVCKVPDGHYFMMGDNRDNSLDSRYWGFVPDANVVGRAFFVWMNFGDLGRIGSFR